MTSLTAAEFGRMPGAGAAGDEALFADRARGRALGERRSRARVAAFAPWLGIDLPSLAVSHPPTVIVTGSKGKGTAAAYASATLAAAGLRVGTLTSPGLRSNRERIRVDGAAIDAVAYAALIARAGSALHDALPSLPDGGYLAPTGLFTLCAVRHFLDCECDAWVLEAGMGGASDEVSLFAGDALALTPVFDEHIGVLSDTVRGIADDKIAAVSPGTPVLSAAQVHPDVLAALHDARVTSIVESLPLDGVRWPVGLSRGNAWVGVRAALTVMERRGLPPPSHQELRRMLDTVRLPGRLSSHRRGEQRWLVDAAANPAAVRAALQHCRRSWGEPSAVLACFPDGKNVAACVAALDGTPCTAVRVAAAHLTFASWRRRLPALDDIDLDSLGTVVLAVGTVSFAGAVLSLLDVDTGRMFGVSRG